VRPTHALDGICALLNQTQDLVELGREQIERGQDAAVRTEIVSARESAALAGRDPMGERTHTAS
jgi:hypothetical protein